MPLTDKTHNLFTKERLLKMPKGGFVINARGGIVDEGAVRDLTKTGHLGGAGFDVFSIEPIVANNPLLKAERCWLSPYTAAFTAESLERMSTQAAQKGQLICLQTECHRVISIPLRYIHLTKPKNIIAS